MARPAGRPRYDTKQKLIAAMRELLAERGYTATSPKMVLDRAKLGQGSLYYHFTGKEDFAVQTVRTLMDRSLTILANALDADDQADVLDPDDAAAARVDAALTGLFDWREGAALLRLLADPAASQPGPLADAIAVWVRALRLLLTQTHDAQQPGQTAAAADAEQHLSLALGRALLRVGSRSLLGPVPM